MKKFRIILTIMFAVFIFAASVMAEDASASSETAEEASPDAGNVNITYYKGAAGKNPVAGAEFTLYKIGTLNEDASFNGLIDGVTASDPDSILPIVQKAYETEVKGGRTYTDSTGSDGILHFTDVSLGVYLGYETLPAKGYASSAPFIISVPVTDNNVWSYTVSVVPKSNPVERSSNTKEVKAYKKTSGNVKTGDDTEKSVWIITGCAALILSAAAVRRKKS